MTQQRQTQQTQNPTQRKTDKTIVCEMLGGDYGRMLGIGPKIKKSVRTGDYYRPSSSSSQSSGSQDEIQALRDKCNQMYEVLARLHPNEMANISPPRTNAPPPTTAPTPQPTTTAAPPPQRDDNDDEEMADLDD